jgi:hypothetical protein
MAIARGVTALTTAALLLAVGTSCADSRNDPATSGLQTPTSSSPKTITEPPTASEAASQAASDVVRSYFAVLDRLRRQPNRPLSELSKVTTSIQLSSQKTLLKGERRKGLRQIGDTKIADLNVQSVNLDNSDPKVGKVPTVVVDVCWNVSDADLVDKSGKSVVSRSRPDIGWTRYTVANYHWKSNRTYGWRVASGQDLKRTPCAGV